MKNVKKVCLSCEQYEQLAREWLRFNDDLEMRPLILPRDFEMLIRFVNTVATANFHRKEMGDGAISVSEEDISTAVDLFDEVIHWRKQLYDNTERKVSTLKERIYAEIVKLSNGKSVKTTDVKTVVVDSLCLCAKKTFYRRVDDLVSEKKVARKGKRDPTLFPLLVS